MTKYRMVPDRTPGPAYLNLKPRATGNQTTHRQGRETNSQTQKPGTRSGDPTNRMNAPAHSTRRADTETKVPRHRRQQPRACPKDHAHRGATGGGRTVDNPNTKRTRACSTATATRNARRKGGTSSGHQGGHAGHRPPRAGSATACNRRTARTTIHTHKDTNPVERRENRHARRQQRAHRQTQRGRDGYT